jgi:hypothetical protein
MNEDLLSFIWQYRRFKLPLTLIDGKPIEVLKSGWSNPYSGPDFSDARIVVDGRTWAGQVELHVKSSDFFKHGHQNDEAYSHLILHVVWEHDIPIEFLEDKSVPTLELRQQVEVGLVNSYSHLVKEKSKIVCISRIADVPNVKWLAQLERSAIERLERKSEDIKLLLHRYTGDWEQTLYHLLLEGFGMKANRHAFGVMAGALPFGVLKKHSDDTDAMLALFKIVSGLALEANEKQVNFLKTKYQLTSIGKSVFKTGGVRPPNQPVLRLKQLACFLRDKRNLVAEILRLLKEEESAFEGFSGTKPPGKDFVNHLFINVLCPFAFYYGRALGHEDIALRSTEVLRKMAPENNSVIQLWRNCGKNPSNAFESQAQLELYKFYCSAKKCLFCAVGITILGKND